MSVEDPNFGDTLSSEQAAQAREDYRAAYGSEAFKVSPRTESLSTPQGSEAPQGVTQADLNRLPNVRAENEMTLRGDALEEARRQAREILEEGSESSRS